MSNIVKTISTEIKNAIMKVKFFRYGKSDVQEVRQVTPFGIDSNPIEGLAGLYVKTEQKGDAVLVGYIQDSLTDVGELRLSSTNASGVEQSYTLFKNDGDIELNGNSDNLVRYSKLEDAFNELRTDFNNLVTAYNSHTHITTATVGGTPTPGVLTPTPTTGSPSIANILPAKIENIKTN